MNRQLTLQDVTATPITEGDAGIILKKDGTFQIFNCHKNLDPNNLTPEQMAQGEKLLALATALNTPEIMNVLIMMATDPRMQGGLNMGTPN